MEKLQDKEIQIEIEKLAKVYDPYSEKIKKRAELMNDRTELQNKNKNGLSREEIEALDKQIKDLDDEVRRELGKE